jgi:hypothetical protein
MSLKNESWVITGTVTSDGVTRRRTRMMSFYAFKDAISLSFILQTMGENGNTHFLEMHRLGRIFRVQSTLHKPHSHTVSPPSPLRLRVFHLRCTVKKKSSDSRGKPWCLL